MKKLFLAISLPLLCAAVSVSADDDPFTPRSQLVDTGRAITRVTCWGCHNGYEVDEGVWADEGTGYPQGIPPLANSDYFMAIRTRPVSILLDGLCEEITVNGHSYNGCMPSFDYLSDVEIAGVVTYIRAVLNDSNVVSCGVPPPSPSEFVACTKTPRDPGEIANDSIAVWEVTNIRNGITRLAGGATNAKVLGAGSFRVTGSGSHVFVVPAGSAGRDALRIVDAWGRTVWLKPVAASDRELRWNGTALNGRKVAPGMYHARFEPRRR